MQVSEDVKKHIAELDDKQLIQRWTFGLFSGDAETIAEQEMRERGIDPNKPVSIRPNIVVDSTPAQPQFKPKLLPIIFIIIGAPAGTTIGIALLGAIGAMIFSGLCCGLGWWLGAVAARFARDREKRLVRLLIYFSAIIAWFLISTTVLVIGAVIGARGAR